MSTYLYLVCKDHAPELWAFDESGQHLSDLPQIQADIADRAAIVQKVREEEFAKNYFRRNTERFLIEHPTCRLGIQDEYRRDHPIEDAAPTDTEGDPR